MTIETYPEMNAKVIELLRWDTGNSLMLYAAQRIEELERVADVRCECLEMATEALQRVAGSKTTTWRHDAARILFDIEARLAAETERALREKRERKADDDG